MNTPDNYSEWARHDAENEKWLARLPKCTECDEPIQDERCYEFDGELICPSCLEAYHAKDTDDFTF